jgi:hypothetical protein
MIIVTSEMTEEIEIVKVIEIEKEIGIGKEIENVTVTTGNGIIVDQDPDQEIVIDVSSK